MLKGKNVVVIKGDKENPTRVIEYDRVYLEFSGSLATADVTDSEGKVLVKAGDPYDKLEDFTKTSEGKDLKVNGSVWKGQKPAGKTSNAPTEILLSESLAYCSAQYPKSNPYLIMLEGQSYGMDLWVRNDIQAKERPGKPVDKGAAIEKMAKVLMALNPKMTREKAMIVATAASESE